MATTPNVGLDLPDEEKTVADEVRRLAGNLVLLDGLIKALQTLVGQKAATGHTHTLAQVAGLVDELAAKMPADREFSLADIVDVIGSVNAPAGYIFVKRADGNYEFVSSAAAIGTHKHIATDIIDFDEKVSAKIANLTGNAPAALDTLYELAAAIGNDPNIRQTLLNAIAAKIDKSGGTFTGNLTVQNGAPQITFADTDWGNRFLHSNSGNVGFLNNGGGWAAYSTNDGDFITARNLSAGSALYQNNGDINGSAWGQWGSNWATTAIGNRIESRAAAYADDRLNQVQGRVASWTVGQIGTYAFAWPPRAMNPGDQIGGNELRYADTNSGSNGGFIGGGTWMCMGVSEGGDRETLFLRRG